MKHMIPLAVCTAFLMTAPVSASVNCFKSGEKLQCTGADDESGAAINIIGVVVDGVGVLTGTAGDKPVTANASPADNSILINGSYDGGQVFGACYLNDDGTACL